MSLLINITALETRDKREEGKIAVALFRNKVHGEENVSPVTRHMAMSHSTKILVQGIQQSVSVNFYNT